MHWINVQYQTEIPLDKTIIVEDENGWIGQAHFDSYYWVLETFGQTYRDITFGKIIRYIILED